MILFPSGSESAQQLNIYSITQEAESVEDTNQIDTLHVNGNDSSSTHSEPTEHVYALLEEPQLSSSSVDVTETGENIQILTTPEITETQDTSIQIKQKPKSKSTTHTSIPQTKGRLQNSPREFVQIYDLVGPETSVVYEEICHTSRPSRKCSLPANLAVFQSSTAPPPNLPQTKGRLQNSPREFVQTYDLVGPETSVVYDEICHTSRPSRKRSLPANLTVLQSSTAPPPNLPQQTGSLAAKSPPIYSIPDMKKKREERMKKIEEMDKEERIETLRKISTTSCPPFMLINLTPKESEEGCNSQNPVYINNTDVTARKVERHHENPTKMLTLNQLIEEEVECSSQNPTYINHTDVLKIEEHYEDPTKTLFPSVYDEPTSLNLVPKKTNRKTSETR